MSIVQPNSLFKISTVIIRPPAYMVVPLVTDLSLLKIVLL